MKGNKTMSKKFLSVILTAALILTAASCGTTEEETTTTTTTAAAETTPEETTTEAETEEAETEATEETPAEDDATTSSETQKLTDVIMNSGVELPATTVVEDPAIISDVLQYDTTLFSEYTITMHLMSAHLIEITVAKPAEGKEADALAFLENRMNQLKTEVAFYPEQQDTADQTVVGEAGGYVYLICCDNAPKAEEALKAAING